MPEDYECKPYDHLTKIALESKNKIGRKKIWEANKDELERKNPNILFTKVAGNVPGEPDVIEIPDPEEQEGDAPADQESEYEIGSTDLFLRLRILKGDYTPVEDNTEYSLDIEDAEGNSWTEDNPKTGWKKDKVKQPPIKDGLIEVEIPPTAKEGVLTLRLKAEDTDKPKSAGDAGGDKDKANRGDVPVKWELKIGALNPIREEASTDRCVSGVQQRLNNLGINSGPVDGIHGPLTSKGVTAFQNLFKLEPDADPGPITQGKLHEVHDTKDKVKIPKD